jgi:uncharacterized protein
VRELRGRVLVEGSAEGWAEGRVLLLRKPISFWGGVDPESGRIADPRHPDHGVELAGRILAVPATIGSSSSSAVMLELLRGGRAPAALLLGSMDAILVLGVVVAGEMGYRTIPVLEIAPELLTALPPDAPARVAGDRLVLLP